MAATADLLTNTKVEALFENLEVQRCLLPKCMDLYKTLTCHLTTLQQSIDYKTQTLESNLESLDSHYRESLDNLNERESSIPSKLSSLSDEVKWKRDWAIAELGKPVDEKGELSEVLKALCRRMDHRNLLRFVMSRRKEEGNALRREMRVALKDCVDPTRVVLDSVKEFTEAKARARFGGAVVGMRRACGVVVTGLFPLEELKEENVGPVFARKTVEEAAAVVRDWKEKAAREGKGGVMGSDEALPLLQLVLGFGLKAAIGEDYCKKLVIKAKQKKSKKFVPRRNMAMLAVPIFGDQVADSIDQLVQDGMYVEAVYFAKESGLTERFQPVSLLKSALQDSEKKTTEILKKGNHNAGATSEANDFETRYIRSIVSCVEDHKLEAEFPVGNLRKRISLLEKAKANRRKGYTANSKTSNKRTHGSSGPPQSSSGAHPPCPAKMRKFPSPYPSPYGHQQAVSPARNPVSRYLGLYSLSGQAAYDPGLTAPTDGPGFGATSAPISDLITEQGQQHYGVPVGSVPSPGPRVGSIYGLQSAYGGAYDYAAVATSPYQPPYS